MKLRLLSMVGTLAICGAAALSMSGIAGASGPAKTKVTIQAESDGFFGFVKSKRQRCANGRKVTLFKQKGSEQSPSTDTKVGSDIAQPNGDGFMWSTGNTGSTKGKWYARARRVSGCRAGSSPTIHG